MQMSENVNPLERSVDVAVPLDLINSEVDSRLKRLQRTVKMHGFRPGKVPLKVVAQQYGREVRHEVIETELQKRFGAIAQEQSLKIAGYPSFEEKAGGEGGENMGFSAVFEVYPDVVVGDLSASEFTRQTYEVSDVDVDRTLDIIRKQRASHLAVDRAARIADIVNIDFEGKIGGEAFSGGSGRGMSVELGEQKLLPDFEQNIVGMKAGESKTFDITFPEDYHGKDVAGKTAQFEVTVNRVEEAQLPAMDEHLARQLGVADGDMAKVRAEIEGNLKREVKRRIDGRLKEEVMQALLDVTKIDLPRTLVGAEANRLAQNAREDLEARGLKNMPVDSSYFLEQAGRRVALGLIIGEVVRINGLKPGPEEVRAVIEDFAENYEYPEEFIQWHYASPERLADAESLALEQKVVDWVLSQGKVVEKAATFDELMGK